MNTPDWWTRVLRRRKHDEAIAEKTEMPTLPFDPWDHWPSEEHWEQLRQLPPVFFRHLP